MPDELPPQGNNSGQPQAELEQPPINPDTSQDTGGNNPVAISVQEEVTPVTAEELAERNKELGEEAVRIAKHEDEEHPVLKFVDPYYWASRKFWKEKKARNNQSQEELRQEAEKHIGELQGEANNIAAAYSEYEQAQTILSHKLDAEPIEQSMDQFIRELDGLTGARPNRYGGSEKEQVTEEQYKQAGKFLAVTDFFTPHLPIEYIPSDAKRNPGMPTSYVRDYPTASGSKAFETFGNGHRLPRLEVTMDKQQAQAAVEQSGVDHVLEINVRTSSVGGATKPEATKRYVLLDDETYGILADTAESLRGVVGLGTESNMYGTFRGPWAFIDYSGRVISKDRLSEPESKVNLHYRTSDGHYHISELAGSDSDLREQAFEEVAGQEWGPGSGLNTVNGADVELPDGKTVSWDEYVKPVVAAEREND